MKKQIEKNVKNAKDFIIKNKVLVAVCLVVIGLLLIINPFKERVNIVESPSSKLKLVEYDSANFSMQIPEGWVVDTSGEDMFFSIKVYDPNDSRYQIFSILKAYPLLKNYNAKSWYENYYNTYGGENNKYLAKAIVVNGTVESFYSSFNEYATYARELGIGNNLPDLRNFLPVESFENNSQLKSVAKDDKILRGTFQDTKTNKNGEGLFMATLVDSGSYTYLLGYDVLFYAAYNVMGITTGEYDLVNYQELLIKSLNSLVYKDSFVNRTIQNGQEQTKNVLAFNASIQQAYDSYNSAWSARQKTYDITSQKYSDATLGYQRVIDKETNDIYKAYNGFLDDYSGNRYEAITDDMYTEPVKGYIEK